MSIGLLSVAACGDDGGSATIDAPKAIDAAVDAIPDSPPADVGPTYDFSCLGNSAPTTIATTVAISGTAQEIYVNGVSPGIRANPGVTVKACKGNCTDANDLGTSTSALTTGAYSTANVTTNGVALDGYLDATKTGDRRTLVFPPSPVAQSQNNVPILQFSTAAFSALNMLGVITQNDTTNGLIGIVVTDCANMPINGATVTVTQNGAAAGDAPYDLGALAQGMADGTWLISNVPPGTATVTAKYGTMNFRPHDVTSVIGATTTTGVRPGF